MHIVRHIQSVWRRRKQRRCKHRWDMDPALRVIFCEKCGSIKRAIVGGASGRVDHLDKALELLEKQHERRTQK